MSSIINGKNLKISVFGQSHSNAIGCIIDGLPAGIKIDMQKTQAFMARRAPGSNAYSTQRKEADSVQILSGLANGFTCAAPLCAIIQNTDTKSKDYSELKIKPRPSHADFPYYIKSNGFNDISGGGHSSGRLTAPLCFAGGVALQILEAHNISVKAHVSSVKGIYDDKFNAVSVQNIDIANKEFPVINDEQGVKMKNAILAAKDDGNSVGGTIECAVIGMPQGIGDPMFDGIENRLSANIFGIPAVKGIEFGCGFDFANMYGSDANDEFAFDENGNVVTLTNNNGGILGGITTGMPIIFSVVIKPTPSIAKIQNTVNLATKQNDTLQIIGRHDPCIVQRAVPVVEAVSALTMLDFIL